MNQPSQDLYSTHSHMTTGSASYGSLSQTTGAGGMSHYQHYPPQSNMPPAGGAYAPTGSSYGGYYGGGVTSPQSAGSSTPASMGMPLPAIAMQPAAHPQHQYGAPAGQGHTYGHPYDGSGQTGPPGTNPRVTATLWEDEGSLCFQVEAKGVCVARREDNQFINGTKLLNVAGMTRGRRDGILKSEKTKHVVKIGPMHLKGVWIPFERALDFANREKIVDLLYPLFVHNIGALLYHPNNPAPRGNMLDKRRGLGDPKQGGGGVLATPASSAAGPPGLHHHHSISGAPLPSQVGASSIAPHPGAQGSRPGLDRAHTFPTPPTSASSVLTGQGSNFDWSQPAAPSLSSAVPGPAAQQQQQQQQAAAQQTSAAGGQPLAIDTGLSNARSLPATPAGTPPGPAGMHGLPSAYGSQAQSSQQPPPPPLPQPQSQAHSYDTSRSMYSSAPQPVSQYATQQHNLARFGQPMQPNPYMKHDMGPPSSRGGLAASGSGAADADHQDIKPDPYAAHGAPGPDEEGDPHDTDGGAGADYGHDSYGAGRVSYSTYPGTAGIAAMHGDHTGLGADAVAGSPHQNGSGRVTPRSSVAAPSWAGYHTPPRSDTYPPSSYGPALNGTPSAKRGRDDDDEYKARGGEDADALKRLKSSHDGGGSPYSGAGQPLAANRSTLLQRARR